MRQSHPPDLRIVGMSSREAYCYNLFGLRRFKVHGESAVSPGEHQLRVEFDYDGGGWGRAGQ
jgi:hypothetical protein